MHQSVIPASLRPDTPASASDPATRGRIETPGEDVGHDEVAYLLVVCGRNDACGHALVEYCQHSGFAVRQVWLDNLEFRWRPMMDLVAGATGIYFRGLNPDDTNTSILNAVRSALVQHPNVVMPPAASRNWSKPMQVAELTDNGDNSAVLPVPTRITNRVPSGPTIKSSNRSAEYGRKWFRPVTVRSDWEVRGHFRTLSKSNSAWKVRTYGSMSWPRVFTRADHHRCGRLPIRRRTGDDRD